MKDFIIPSDRDFGTPYVRSTTTVTLNIDGFDVTVPEGTSIMRAAAEIGITVPKLCATDSIDAFGSCRLCLVEIEGRNGTPASCTTPVAAGIKVKTQTAKLKDLRRGVMELYISDHPLDCLTCAANGDCELQDMAGAVGLRDVRYEAVDTHFRAKNTSGEANPQWMAKDTSNPYFTYDPAKCIVCSRCVRACEEVQGTFALTIEGRGFDSRVSFGMKTDDALASDCVSCGACVQACPTATLSEKSRFTASEQFDKVFREGMGLVEETANYLDGPGRADARTLDRNGAVAYATESMRLTTRLMQLASWLLLQRAIGLAQRQYRHLEAVALLQRGIAIHIHHLQPGDPGQGTQAFLQALAEAAALAAVEQ